MSSAKPNSDVDLVVSNVTFPQIAKLDEIIPISWTVTNQGKDAIAVAKSSRSWYDTVYLSLDKKLDASDRSIAYNQYKKNVGSSENYTFEQTAWIAPSYYTGFVDEYRDRDPKKNYYLIFETDTYEDLGETNEKNNLSIFPLNLKPSNIDLTFSNINAPKVVKFHEPFTIDRTIINQGEEKTLKNWDSSVYLSSDKVIDKYSDYLLNTKLFDKPLKPSRSTQLSDRVTIPPGFWTSYGEMMYDEFGNQIQNYYTDIDHNKNWYLLFQTKTDAGLLDDPNPDNNVVAIEIDLETPEIDLVMSQVTAPEKATIGNAIDVSWTVTKQGKKELPKDSSWLDGVYLSYDGLLDGVDDYRLEQSPKPQTLTDSDSYTVTQSFTIPRTITNYPPRNSVDADRNYYLIVETDYENKIAEAKDQNNYISVPIDIEKPKVDLVVDRLDAPNVTNINKPIEVSWTVSNRGEENSNANFWFDKLVVSRDTIPDNGDYVLSYEHYGKIAPASENYTKNLSISIPPKAAKNLQAEIDKDGRVQKNGYLIIQTNFGWGDEQVETNEDNNTAVVPISLNITKPDLTLKYLELPEVVKLGDIAKVNWTLVNKELVPIERDNLNYSAYLTSYFPSKDRDKYNLGTITNEDKLDRSTSLSTSGKWLIPDTDKYKDLNIYSDIYFVLKADSDDLIDEPNQKNNVIHQQIDLVDKIILGTTGDDEIFGSWGKDFIRGLPGNDAIDAGKNNDIIVDGAGRDTLTGGKGYDKFVFKKLEASANIITDFNRYADRLVLTELMNGLDNYYLTKIDREQMEQAFINGVKIYNMEQSIVDGKEVYSHKYGYLKLVETSMGSTMVYVDPDGYTGDKGWHKLVEIDNIIPDNFYNHNLTL